MKASHGFDNRNDYDVCAQAYQVAGEYPLTIALLQA